MKRPWVKWTLIGLLAAVALAVAAFLFWALTPLGPTGAALAALEGDSTVRVQQTDLGYEFSPTSGPPTTGLVFYPGGHVDFRSYAPICARIAARGHLVVLVPMPLSLAVLAPGRATDVIASHKEIGAWAVGGHSLGGAMAADYVAKHADTVDGLVLYAAYASGSADLSDTNVSVLDTYGSKDGVLNRENHAAGKALMPPSYTEFVIEGGNHGQFGNYGPQPGDNPASIGTGLQQQVATDETQKLLQEIAP